MEPQDAGAAPVTAPAQTPTPETVPTTANRVIAIFGARSEIGGEVAARLAKGNVVVLAARAGALEDQRERCLRAGAKAVETVFFDADETAHHRAVVEQIETDHGPIDVAVLTFGILGNQDAAESDEAEVTRILHTDFVAQASLLTVLADRMRPRAGGTLVAFSSVAGRRVRRANYVYGSAKAGLDGFASGLADALHGSGVRLIIARPGFVIGRMAQGMKPAPFSSTPAQVGAAVVDSIEHGSQVELWIPWQLRVMFAPAPFFPRSLWRRLPR